MRSVKPPSSLCTGLPRAFPIRSHRAMSMALMMWVDMPRRPTILGSHMFAQMRR